MWAVLNSKSKSLNLVERLCFPAPKASYTIRSFPEELILIPREDGEKVPCLFLPFRHARFLFIYFHANAEDLGLCYTFCTIIRDLFQVHMLAVEYPGYGICPGHCDEEGMMANANAAIRFALDTLAWPCDGIKLFGRSIGTGPAVALAAKHDMAGLILVTPFLSIQRIFRAQVGPLAGLISDRFDNYELARKIESPTLIIHGQQDTLIPLAHSKMIYDAIPAKKMMVCPAMMGHNTSLLANVGTFVLPMTQFFSLPDYTFEDIEVPSWVFPDLDNDKVEEEGSQWVCATSRWMSTGAETPRMKKVISECRGGSDGNHLSGIGGASVGFPLPLTPRQPTTNAGASDSRATSGYTPSQSSTALPVKPIPSMKGAPDDKPEMGRNSLKASRNYDFRTPPTTPRGDCGAPVPSLPLLPNDLRGGEQLPTLQRDPLVEDGGLDSSGKDPPSGEKVHISEDMQHAIESGISWLVDTNSDVTKLDKDDAARPENALCPGTLRGAPELRERIVERLRESEPEAIDRNEPTNDLAASMVIEEHAPSSARTPQRNLPELLDPETDKVANGDDSTTDMAEPLGDIGEDDDDPQRYRL